MNCWASLSYRHWESTPKNFDVSSFYLILITVSDFRLKAFYSVAKNLSFTKASQELFVSQPAITKHIRELESLYQVRLFNRMGNKISLTEAGTVLLEHFERILTEYRRLEYDIHLLHKAYAGELRLGALSAIAPYLRPPVLAPFS